MSNPLCAPRKTTSDVPECFLDPAIVAGLEEKRQEYAMHPERVLAMFQASGVDLQPEHSIVLDVNDIADNDTMERYGQLVRTYDKRKKEAEVKGEVFAGKKPALYAEAQKGRCTVRRRTVVAHSFVVTSWSAMPQSLQEQCAERMRQTCQVAGGTQLTFGRLLKYIPRKNPPKDLDPPLGWEIELAMSRSGLPSGHGVLPSNIFSGGVVGSTDADRIRLNFSAEAGYPTCGKLDDFGVILKAREIAGAILEHLRGSESYEEARARLRQLKAAKPGWFVNKGKCKTDCYTVSKLRESMLRFYFVSPLPLRLIMGSVLQPLEDNAACAIDVDTSDTPEEGVTTVKGINLTRGGAQQLVFRKEAMLAVRGISESTCGDDTWLTVRLLDGIVNLSVDCSSFDLTQRKEVTHPIHAAIGQRLQRIEPLAAYVWQFCHEHKTIALFRRAVVSTEHCGPSGTPGQSTVNDVLMNIMLIRLERRWQARYGYLDEFDKSGMRTRVLNVMAEEFTRELVEEDILATARSLGLTARVDDYALSKSRTLYEALQEAPFKFVGYNFFVQDNGHVAIEADLPRQMAQLPYPNVAYYEAHELRSLEAVRLASVVINWGLPQPEHMAFYQTVSAFAQGLLESVKLEPNQFKTVAQIENAIQSQALVQLPEVALSAEGLQRALRRVHQTYSPPPLEGETAEEYQNGYGWSLDRYPDILPHGFYGYTQLVPTKERSEALSSVYEWSEMVKAQEEDPVWKEVAKLSEKLAARPNAQRVRELARAVADAVQNYRRPFAAVSAKNFGRHPPTRPVAYCPPVRLPGSKPRQKNGWEQAVDEYAAAMDFSVLEEDDDERSRFSERSIDPEDETDDHPLYREAAAVVPYLDTWGDYGFERRI